MIAATQRRVRSPELVVDLGSGTGILALAAKCGGARHVIGFDHDPVAVRVARRNARLNKIGDVKFRIADVRQIKFLRNPDIVMANLFSELLIELLPKLRHSHWVILSGILSEQETQAVRALRRRAFKIVDSRHRGKWVAILAKGPEKRFARHPRGS